MQMLAGGAAGDSSQLADKRRLQRVGMGLHAQEQTKKMS
jgi:hypothetical protein